MASINDGQSVNVNVPIGSSLTVYGSAFVTVDGNKTAINGPRRFGPYTTAKTLTIVGVSGASFDDQPDAPSTVGLTLSATGQTVLDGASKAAVYMSAPANAFGFSMIGDSRTADLLGNGGYNAKNWFNWACAYYKQYPLVVNGYGVIGARTDQYLTNGNFETAIADGAKWLIFGLPCYNDINQANAGYTDTFGRSVNLTNVAAYACDNIITYAKRAVAAGESVILLTEPGGSLLNASQVAAVHEFNRLIKNRVSEVPGAILYDPCPVLWNPTAGATSIGFKTNYTSDNIHNQQMAARAIGADFAANVLPAILPKIDTAPSSLSDSIANGTNQLYRNPLFNTLTGGTNGGNFTLTSGTIPANMTLSGSAAGLLSVVITSAANANGFGNDVTFACTATGAVSFRIDLDLNNADWNLTDQLEGRIEVDVASGGTGMGGVYAEMFIATNLGTKDYWANFAGAMTPPAGPMSTAGDAGLVLRTRRGAAFDGSSSKTSAKIRVWVTFTGAGSQTITLRRPGIYRY